MIKKTLKRSGKKAREMEVKGISACATGGTLQMTITMAKGSLTVRTNDKREIEKLLDACRLARKAASYGKTPEAKKLPHMP